MLTAQGLRRHTLCTVSHFSVLGAFLRELPALATVPKHVAVRLGELHSLTLSAVPAKMPRFTISALWRTEVDRMPENNWIRQLCAEFVRVHEL